MSSVLHLLILWTTLSVSASFAPARTGFSGVSRWNQCFYPFPPTTSLAATSAMNQTSTLTLANAEKNETNALALHEKAAALRAEIALLESDLEASKEAKKRKELADIDRWIEECLYVNVKTGRSDDEDDDEAARIELLNSVETTAAVLRDNRYSHEQVSKMFERICDTSPAQSRSNCSPLLALLVDAAGRLDCVERQENPNKRWDGRVERDLRKRLFAMDWNIHLEPELDNNDRFL